MSITITSATVARGYSGYDHLIDDTPLAGIVGRTFPDLDAAARFAGQLLRGTQDRRCAGAPVILHCADGSGWIRWPG